LLYVDMIVYNAVNCVSTKTCNAEFRQIHIYKAFQCAQWRWIIKINIIPEKLVLVVVAGMFISL